MEQDDFRKLALSEMDAVYRLAYHLSRLPQEVDDLVQETFLRAFKSWSSFKATDHGIRPWLFKILHNVINTRFSKEQRHRQLLGELQAQASTDAPIPDEMLLDDSSRGGPIPDLSSLNWEAVDERLKAAIDDLPLSHRTAFLLCAVEGLRYREIADVMEVPLGTVMSRLYRARAQLSFQLAALGAERRLTGGHGPPPAKFVPREPSPESPV